MARIIAFEFLRVSVALNCKDGNEKPHELDVINLLLVFITIEFSSKN